MVKLHVKYHNESQFLYETKLSANVGDILEDLVSIYNGRTKVSRVVSEVEDLANHGVIIQENLMGLLENQILELGLTDQFEESCVPSGGFCMNKDPVQRRNGRAPQGDMKEVLVKTAAEAKAKISRENVDAGVEVNQKTVQEALDILSGACKIVYPMGLPPHDPIRLELENAEELEGTQASKQVIDFTEAVLWFATKEMARDKPLAEYLGKNEKTKVIVKLSKKGSGPPGREPVFNEEERKEMMMQSHRRQEELKKLSKEEDDDNYLNSAWANPTQLKRQFQGLANVHFKA